MNTVSREKKNMIEQEMQEGEILQWCEEPNAVRHALIALPNLFIGMLFSGFAAFWICSAYGYRFPDFSDDRISFFPLIGVVFFCAGLVIALMPLWAYISAKKAVYAITNKRAIIIEGLFSISVRSFYGRDLRGMERKQKGDGSGDIIFKREVVGSDSRNNQRIKKIGFIGIHNVKQTESRLNLLAENN